MGMDKIAIYTLDREGEIFYVGYTNNPKSRISAHKKKFGKNIKMDIIEYRDDYREAEQQWINYFSLLGYKLENICKGGNGRNPYPADAKIIIHNITKWIGKGLNINFENNISTSFENQLQNYYQQNGYEKTYDRLFRTLMNAIENHLFPNGIQKLN